MIKYNLIDKILISFFINIFLFSKDKQKFEDIANLYKDGLYMDVISKGEDFLKENPSSINLNTVKLYVGEAQRNRGNFEKAISLFKTLYSTNLKDRAHYETVITYLKWDKIKEALIDLKQIKKEEFIQKANYFIARDYYNKNMLKEGRDYFTKIINDLSYNYKEALLYMGMISFKEKKFMDSISYFENYLVENKDISEDRKDNIIFQIADSYYNLEMYKESLKESMKIIKKENSIARKNALIMCIRIFKNQNDNLNLNKYLNLTIDQLNATDKIDDLKALSYMLIEELNNNQKALEIYNIVSSKGFDVDIELAKLYFNLKKYNEALKICSSRNENIFFSIKVSCYYSLDDYDKIISLEKDIMTVKDQELITLLGDSYYFKNDFKSSLSVFKSLYLSNKQERYLNKIIHSLFMLNDKDILDYFNEYKIRFSGENVKSTYKVFAEYLLKNNKKLESEKILKDLFQLYKDDDVLKNLLNVLVSNNKYDEVIGYSSQFKNLKDRKLFEAIANMNKHQYDKAINILTDINIQYPEDLEILKNLLDSLYFSSKYNDVISFSKKNIDNKEIYLFLIDRMGMSYSKLNNYKEAISCYEKLYLESSEKDYALVKIAEIYYNLKNYNLSLDNYKKVLLEFPKSIYVEKCRYHRIVIMSIIKDYDNLISASELFLRNHKDSLYIKEVFSYLGEAYFNKKDYEKSFDNYNLFIDQTSDEDRKQNVLTSLALKFKEVACYEKSKKLALKISNLDERNIILAGILESSGKNQEATSIYRKLLESGNDNAAFFVANDLFKNKKFEEAKQLYRKCIKDRTNKNRNEAIINLSLIYEEEGDFKKAIINLNSIKNIYRGDNLLDVYITLARNYEKLKDYKNAIEVYKDSFNLFKGSSQELYILEKLIELNLKHGDKIIAKKYHLEVKKLNENIFNKYNDYFKNN